MDLDLESLILKSKCNLKRLDPFLGAIALTVPFVPEDINTWATDGKQIYYPTNHLDLLESTDFSSNYYTELTTLLIAHECMHIALKHCSRGINKNRELWNKATDYVINSEENLGSLLPKFSEYCRSLRGLLCPPKFEGLSAEEIYAVLKVQQDNDNSEPEEEEEEDGDNTGSGDGKGAGNACNNDLRVPKNSKELEEVIQAENRIVTEAKIISNIQGPAATSTGVGRYGGSVHRNLNLTKVKAMAWSKLLAKYVNNTEDPDYSWSKRNRRYSDVYLPSLHNVGDNLSEVHVYVDLSGSIDTSKSNAFLCQVQAMQRVLNLQKVYVKGWAESVRSKPVVITPYSNNLDDVYNDLPNECIGCGTEIVPVVEDINKVKPTVAVVFTDGEFPISGTEELKYPVIWVNWGKHEFTPWKGKVVDFTM